MCLCERGAKKSRTLLLKLAPNRNVARRVCWDQTINKYRFIRSPRNKPIWLVSLTYKLSILERDGIVFNILVLSLFQYANSGDIIHRSSLTNFSYTVNQVFLVCVYRTTIDLLHLVKITFLSRFVESRCDLLIIIYQRKMMRFCILFRNKSVS